ncbi:MAG TPA: M48 family metalloprotease [Pyrinomonadaceae bacterium]|nr:M48 family metalloprotease [Pyrinomonadaceae bacterium]
MKIARLVFALSLLCASLAAAAAQELPARCQPPAVTPSREPIIFSHRQEMELGDIVAERVQRDFRVVEDDELTAYLRRVGARLVERLPPTELRYQFFLMDLPDVNAFALPGGRIYVTRKMVAFVRSEDELAGVIAHELGHIVARQQAADMTRLLREVLGVNEVADRRDIFEKYNRLIENVARKPGAARGDSHDERQQGEADLIGLYAMSAAGYDPQAAAAVFERATGAKGKSGGWLSNLFGSTSPNTRRLREILKGIQALPVECRTPARATSAAEEFQKWQAAVVSHSGTVRREALHDVVSKKLLEPPLRGEINHLRFSPDGQYLLAQDDSGISVLRREPLAPLFRVDAPEARPAQFTPDSKGVVFHNAALRVESWDIAGQKARAASELYVREGCMQTELAPDGRTLACLNTDNGLAIYDVASGAQIYLKKDFFKPDFQDLVRLIVVEIFRSLDVDIADLGDFDWVGMSFSPDARHFAAGQRSVGFYTGVTESSAFVFDVEAKTATPAKGMLKKLLSGKFTFVAPDRLIGVNPENPRESAAVSFPAGEVLEKFELGGQPDAVARGNYLLLRPVQNFPVGLLDLASKKVVMANKQRAFDVYGDTFVSERTDGAIGLYNVETRVMSSKVALPRGRLGRLRAAAVSPDFKWLAVSERSRGAVWDLAKGERVAHVRGFRGAHFDEAGELHADFPSFGGTDRMIAKMNPATRETAEGPAVETGGGYAEQRGPYVVTTRPTKKGGGLREKVTIEVREAVSGKTLWTKDFPKESPRVWVAEDAGLMVLLWPIKSDAAKAEIKADAKLAEKLPTMKEKEGDYLLRTLDIATGERRGALLVETGKGSFRISSVAAAGDLLVISDTENRVLVYSVSDGAQRAQLFGRRPAVSKAAGLVAVENERGQLNVHDLASGERRDQFVFPDAVSHAQFSPDGRRLLVLTSDQTVYVLDLAAKTARSDK